LKYFSIVSSVSAYDIFLFIEEEQQYQELRTTCVCAQ